MRILRYVINFIFWAAIYVLMSTTTAFAVILQVPYQYRTIQEAINISRPGDTIIVAPGEYRLSPGNIIIDKESLTLKSAGGASNTIIVGSGNSSVITVLEGSRAVIDGFTITSAKDMDMDTAVIRGGGIYCAPSSSPVITNNIITRNNAVYGGAIYCDRSSSPAIINNIISQNRATGIGGGIYSYWATPNINRNRLVENEAARSGGGIYSYRDSSRITNNVIWKNKAKIGGGISCDRCGATVINDTITANMATYGGGIFVDRGSVRMINLILWQNEDDFYFKELNKNSRPDHSNIGGGDFRGLNGNISADPLFADPENDDFRLQPGSPSINSGNPELIYNDHDGSRNDMGAYGGPEGPKISGEISDDE
jgi:serine protease